MGYGYQLRKYSDQISKVLDDNDREFGHSWTKRSTPLS